MLQLIVNKTYSCQFCGNKYTQEKTLAVHICEQKRRYLAKDEKHVNIGYIAFNKFFQLTQKLGQNKTYEEFARSPYYNAFVKFGSFVNNTNPLYPEKFIDYVIRSGVKLDHWCRDELYTAYIIELIKTEPADGAIQRTIKTMMEWGDTNSAPWEHYFQYVNLNRATHNIKEGLVSPWLVLNTKAGKEMLNRMNDEQLDIIALVIDPQFWIKRFKALPADVELVKDVIKEAVIL